MPVNRFQVYSVPMLGGGLNLADAPEALHDTEARVLDNAVLIGEGRVTSRRGMVQIGTAPGPVLSVIPFDTTTATYSYGCVFLVHNTAASSIQLYRGTADGKIGSLEGTLWTGVSATDFAELEVSHAIVNERLFLCDKGAKYGLVVFQPHETTTIYTPLFDFDGDDAGGTARAYPRLLVAYNNMVLMAGYGSESDPKRPELVHFSYPGLVADTEGGGDAGDPTDVGYPTNLSAWLFARDDYFMVGTRGVPVTGMGTSRGRLVICNPYSSYLLYGFDRNSFALELLDNERGCLSQRTMVEAHGVFYWWSSKGPVRWTGGQVEDIWEKIKPRLEKIDPENMFAVHVPEFNQVRWYYGETVNGVKQAPVKAVCFDYKRSRWIDLRLGRSGDHTTQLRVSAGAIVRPKVAVFSPAAAPSGLAIESITETSAIAVWTNGDYSADLRTEVFLAPDNSGVAGTYSLNGVLKNGESRYQFTGLTAQTRYWVRVDHKRAGSVVASAVVSFTTKAPDTPPVDPGTPATVIDPPRAFSLRSVPIEVQQDVFIPGVLISWIDSAPGVSTKIYRKGWTEAETTFTMVKEVDRSTQSREQSSYTDYGDHIRQSFVYEYYLEHHTQNGNKSDPTATLSVTANGGGTKIDPTLPGDEDEEGPSGGGTGGGSPGGAGGEGSYLIPVEE